MLKVGLAQIAPVWLDRDRTIEKTLDYLNSSSYSDLDLIVFGEAYLPGYPFWLSSTNSSEFNSELQKEIHAYYISQAVVIEEGHLDSIKEWAKESSTAIYIGIVERALDRGGHSLYCSLVFINAKGEIDSAHRKLQPTYEERLCWSPGDGNGLRTHSIGEFTAGGLNCWENWMPLSRSALYAQGENLHIAVWPGSMINTRDITQFIAKESRSFVVSVSSLLKKSDINKAIPYHELMIKKSPEIIANGGSCIARPNGEWLIPPIDNQEKIITASIEIAEVYKERQNFDPSGHYSRPDVLGLSLNQNRQKSIEIKKS